MSLASDIEPEYNSNYFGDVFEDESIFKRYIEGILFWVTKDKSNVLIEEMTSSHIKNILRISIYPNKKNWDLVFNYELKKRIHI